MLDLRDRIVTLVGGSGFIGRYTVRALARTGARLRIACRDPRDAYLLRPLAAIGQIQAVPCDVARPGTVARALEGSWAVVNLVGILKGPFDLIQRAGAAAVVAAAARAGAERFVHVSAIGADPRSASAYGRSKGQGEEAVRAAFPAATILRPSVVFGPEDQFLNRFARLMRFAPVVPVIAPATRFQPVYVGDVGHAIARTATEDGHGGQTFELGGPETLTMLELNQLIAELIERRRLFVPVPRLGAELLANGFGWLPGAPITSDQLRMLARDNVANGPGLRELGLRPTPIEAVAEGWLKTYRRRGRFAERGA